MAGVWRFADFELDPANQVLRKGGEPIKLPPQPYKVLHLLVSRAGALVRRQELREALWADRVSVDFEHGLNSCMRQVRIALGDTADDSGIIETIPRVGYRLKVPVHEVLPADRRRVPIALTAAAALVLIAAMWIERAGDTTRPAAAPHVLEAQALYARGRVSLDRATPADTALARQLFVSASAVDPASAPAHAGRALSYLGHPAALAGVPPSEARAVAADALASAAAIDPSAPEVRLAAAALRLASGDWPGAEQEYRRAIDRAPDSGAAHDAFATALALHGRFDEAVHHARRAQMLDPLSPRFGSTVASVLRFARRYDEAITEARRVLHLDPTFGPAFHTLGLAYQALGRLDEAIASYERAGRTSGNLGHALAVAGRLDEARAVLAELERRYATTGTGAGGIAQVYVGLNDHDRVFHWLQRHIDEGTRPTTLKVADVWDPLRADPRFDRLLARLF